MFKKLYSLFMNDKKEAAKIIFHSADTVEGKVADFFRNIDFSRKFPLDLILLAKKMGDYTIQYIPTSLQLSNMVEAAINTEQKIILLNQRFNTAEDIFRAGRYMLCKIISHYALNHIPQGSGWIEPKLQYREDIDKKLNDETAAFAYEILLPKVEFIEQWDKLGKNVEKMSLYFEASQRHILERKNFLLKDNCAKGKE